MERKRPWAPLHHQYHDLILVLEKRTSQGLPEMPFVPLKSWFLGPRGESRMQFLSSSRKTVELANPYALPNKFLNYLSINCPMDIGH